MSLIEINSDLSRASKALERIADALEEFLWQAYHFRTKAIPEPSKEALKDTDEVLYSTDDQHLKREIVDLHYGRNPERTIEDED